MATKRQLLPELRRYRQAERLLGLGARVPVVYEMTRLSNWFLRKLSLEIQGTGPRKGQVPNSELWYLKGRNNLQASAFLSLHQAMAKAAGAAGDPCDLLASAYEQYRAVVVSAGLVPVLSIDRAWWLLKSLQISNLKRVACCDCGGRYVMHFGDLARGYVCDACAHDTSARGRTAPHQPPAVLDGGRV